MQVSSGRDPISVDLSYPVPIYENVKIGGTPRDYFDTNSEPGRPEVPCSDGVCQKLPQEVWRRQPRQNQDGSAVMREKSEHLEDKPASPVWNGIGWGAAGAVGGALIGGALGYFVGNVALGAGAGAVFAGVVTGAYAANEASKDRIELQWVAHAIVSERQTGYRETVTAGQLHGRDGYFHRFQPVIEQSYIGTYQTPQIVHFQPTGKG